MILSDPVVTGFGPIIQQLSFKAYSDTADGNDELTIDGVNLGSGSGSGSGNQGGGNSAPGLPTGVSGQAAGSGQLRISWSAVSGTTSYRVRWRVGAGSYTEADVPSGTTFTTSVAGGLSGSVQYGVRAVNSSSSSDWADRSPVSI